LKYFLLILAFLFQTLVFQLFENPGTVCLKFFSKKIMTTGSNQVGGQRSPNVLHTNLTALTMTATLSYTLLLAAIYLARKMWALRPQNA